MSPRAAHQREGHPYDDGELEVVLSLAPTQKNIEFLSALLRRSERAIELIYKIAFEHGPFGKHAHAMERKVVAAKKRVGIRIGRMKVRDG